MFHIVRFTNMAWLFHLDWLKSGAVHGWSRKTYRSVLRPLECGTANIIHRPLIVAEQRNIHVFWVSTSNHVILYLLYYCRAVHYYWETSHRVVKHIVTRNTAQTISRSAPLSHHYNFSAHRPSLQPLSARWLIDTLESIEKLMPRVYYLMRIISFSLPLYDITTPAQFPDSHQALNLRKEQCLWMCQLQPFIHLFITISSYHMFIHINTTLLQVYTVTWPGFTNADLLISCSSNWCSQTILCKLGFKNPFEYFY